MEFTISGTIPGCHGSAPVDQVNQTTIFGFEPDHPEFAAGMNKKGLFSLQVAKGLFSMQVANRLFFLQVDF